MFPVVSIITSACVSLTHWSQTKFASRVAPTEIMVGAQFDKGFPTQAVPYSTQTPHEMPPMCGIWIIGLKTVCTLDQMKGMHHFVD